MCLGIVHSTQILNACFFKDLVTNVVENGQRSKVQMQTSISFDLDTMRIIYHPQL